MFSCSTLSPPLLPGFLRPPQALSSPLTRSLPSGFLVEDLLRLNQPVGYIHRTFAPGSHGDISPRPCVSSRTSGPDSERTALQSSGQPNRSSGSPHTACADSGYLKFGVRAILAPSTRSSELLLHQYKQNIVCVHQSFRTAVSRQRLNKTCLFYWKQTAKVGTAGHLDCCKCNLLKICFN